jgi:glutaredoxin-related protein
MKKLLFVYLLCFATFTSKAQTFNQTYLSDSVQIKELSNKQGRNYKIINYDNDNYWSKAANNYFVNYNDSLEMMNVLEINNRDYAFKFGNKLYLLNTAFHYDYDTSFNQIFITDSISFIYYDIVNRTESYVNIDDSFIYLNNRYLFFEQSKEIAIVSTPRIEMMDENSVLNSNSFKITILDTLGNVLRYNKIDKRLHQFSFEEQGDNILISGVAYGTNTTQLEYKLYYINKNSLELVDSINVDKDYMYIKAINDSIICGINGIYGVNIDI